MNYLTYYHHGFIKKYPLKKTEITLGRDPENDLSIPEEMISRKHLKIQVKDQSIIIEDLNSSNGTFVNQQPVKKKELTLGESFSVGGIDLYLRKGSLEEFEISKKLGPIFKKIRKDNERKFKPSPTRPSDDLYSEILKKVLQEGMGSLTFQNFLGKIPQMMSGLSMAGSLYLISRKRGKLNIHFAINHSDQKTTILEEVIRDHPRLYSRELNFFPILPSGELLSAYPIKTPSETFYLIYLSSRIDPKITRFFSLLTGELILLTRLLLGKDSAGIQREVSAQAPEEIIAQNPLMKKLILRATKFGRGDLFIMIQGESGTGKELFARLIHSHSQRANREFVALNCAAIPENLLESELFGYEKGAFTGADKSRKGKLEIASGGTLVLDEIGDMSLNLQAKLLRALQEQEFYRLGGFSPIKVDLRILSLTNQDIKQLIRDGNFRKDLYYRLVHRIIKIPPLRDRVDDVGVLINYFASKFCREFGRSINGFSVKTYKALEHYPWEGNVRELENEIRSLINLAEEGETISDELLDEDIRGHYELHYGSRIKLSDHKNDKDFLIELLDKNLWNKSRTARDLGMTYRGLHKKMLRLKITKPEK